MVGAINITGETVYLCCTSNSKYDHRTMYGDLDFDLKTV